MSSFLVQSDIKAIRVCWGWRVGDSVGTAVCKGAMVGVAEGVGVAGVMCVAVGIEVKGTSSRKSPSGVLPGVIKGVVVAGSDVLAQLTAQHSAIQSDRIRMGRPILACSLKRMFSASLL
jgi:hypothetical protein